VKGYLLDTNVISITAPANQARDQTVLDWLEGHSDSLFLSVVTIAEIESGIANAERKEAVRKAALLTAWLEAVLHLYGHRVLPLDTIIARAAGRLDGFARGAGLSPGFADIAIAATAATHGLIILTRNLRHFRPLGLTVLDPLHDPLPQLP
jgi:predicted nucleic acid-binding protein